MRDGDLHAAQAVRPTESVEDRGIVPLFRFEYPTKVGARRPVSVAVLCEDRDR